MAVNLRRSGHSSSFNINQMCSVDDATALKIVSTSPQVLDLEKRGMLSVIRPVAVPVPVPAAAEPKPEPVLSVEEEDAPVVKSQELVDEDEPPIPGAVAVEAALDHVLPSMPKPNSRTTLANLRVYADQQGIEYPAGMGRKDLYKIIKETF